MATLTQGKEYTDTQGTKQIAQYDPNTGAKLSMGQSAEIKPITSTSLQQENPLNIAPTKPSTQSMGLEATLGSLSTSFLSQLQEDAKLASENKDSSLQALIGGITSEGQTGAQSRLYDEAGVNTTEKELKAINNQILAEQESTRRQIEALQKNPQGLFGGALEDAIGDIQDKSLSRQADLAVVQMAKQGQFDSAKAIADRAVAALMERRQNKLQALQMIYQDNKDAFTRAEQRTFEVMQGERERALNNEEYRLRAEFDQTIRQNDPKYLAELRKINSEIDAGNITVTNPQAGKYAGALNIILGSGKFTKDQKASLIASINQGEDPFTVIKNQAKNLLGQTGDTKLTNYETAQSAMKDIQGDLKSFYAQGGKTSFLSGNYESVVNKLGTVDNPELVQLATQIAANLQVYRNAVSGTAYSVQEGVDIAAIFPGINKSEGLNAAILNGRMKAFDSTIDASYRTVLGSAYDELKTVNAQGVKGTQGDSAFVDSALKAIGTTYDDAVAKVPVGQIGVIDNQTGQFGAIPPHEFDAARYTKI